VITEHKSSNIVYRVIEGKNEYNKIIVQSFLREIANIEKGILFTKNIHQKTRQIN